MAKRILTILIVSLFVGSVAWADVSPPPNDDDDDDEGCSMVGTPATGAGAALLLFAVPAVVVGLRRLRR